MKIIDTRFLSQLNFHIPFLHNKLEVLKKIEKNV